MASQMRVENFYFYGFLWLSLAFYFPFFTVDCNLALEWQSKINLSLCFVGVRSLAQLGSVQPWSKRYQQWRRHKVYRFSRGEGEEQEDEARLPPLWLCPTPSPDYATFQQPLTRFNLIFIFADSPGFQQTFCAGTQQQIREKWEEIWKRPPQPHCGRGVWVRDFQYQERKWKEIIKKWIVGREDV